MHIHRYTPSLSHSFILTFPANVCVVSVVQIRSPCTHSDGRLRLFSWRNFCPSFFPDFTLHPLYWSACPSHMYIEKREKSMYGCVRFVSVLHIGSTNEYTESNDANTERQRSRECTNSIHESNTVEENVVVVIVYSMCSSVHI